MDALPLKYLLVPIKYLKYNSRYFNQYKDPFNICNFLNKDADQNHSL